MEAPSFGIGPCRRPVPSGRGRGGWIQARTNTRTGPVPVIVVVVVPSAEMRTHAAVSAQRTRSVELWRQACMRAVERMRPWRVKH